MSYPPIISCTCEKEAISAKTRLCSKVLGKVALWGPFDCVGLCVGALTVTFPCCRDRFTDGYAFTYVGKPSVGCFNDILQHEAGKPRFMIEGGVPGLGFFQM